MGLIILLLSGFAATAWIIERRCATRNWDFKERSLKYLNDVERKRREIPAAPQLDQELVEH